MLKRIFNRNKKGYFKKPRTKQKKIKVSKYNKLNISTEETNMNSYSFIESGPSVDDDDDEIDLPKLNFTCILNNPLDEYNNSSLFGQLLSRFQEDLKIVTEEERIKKEGHKFDLIDIVQDEVKYNNSLNYEAKIMKKIGKKDNEEEEELDDILNDLEQLDNIFGSKKTLEQCIKETNQELFKDKKTFKLKKFIDLSYNNYIAKIKHNYLIYRDNQKKNIIKNLKFEENILTSDFKIENQEQILEQINNYRKSLNSSMNLIEADYKIDSNDFKIKEDLLNTEIGTILEKIQKLIEQKGIIELETEKSNINYDLIKHFFINNYPLSVTQVENMQYKINDLINKKNILKNKFIFLSQRMILLKIKRQNIIKLLNLYRLMIKANCHKIESITDLLDIRETKQKLKEIPDIGINIVQKINEELTQRELNITSDNLNKVITLIKNEINNCFEIEIYNNEEDNKEKNMEMNNKYNYKYYNIDENIYKKIVEYKNDIQENINLNDNIILIMNPLDEEFMKKKIYYYLDLSHDNENYMNKINETLLSSIEEAILTTLGKILPLKNMNEILYLFYLGKMCQYLLNSINKILEEKDKNKLINDANNKLFDIIDKNLFFIFDYNQTDNLDIDKFVIRNKFIKEVCYKIPVLSENKNYMGNFKNYEFNFIENFWKDKCEKIKEILNSDNLKCLDNIPYKYQKFIDIIFSFNKDSFNLSEEKKYENLQNNILLNIELTPNENDPKEIYMIEITKILEGKTIQRKYRLISSSLEIINHSISTIKLLYFFSSKNYSKILLPFHDIVSNFINLSNDIVLETKGQIKNITQNELASSYSSIDLIHQILSQFISFISENDSIIEDDIKNKYKELDNLSSEFMEKNLLKLNNMIKEGIYESSINEFKNIISLENYPIIKGSLPINPFAENLVKLVKNVNKSLKHCYDDETISKIILDNLNLFNEELEKLLENKKELTGEEKKQFKKDFTFIKKNIDNGIDDIDFKGFKNKLNAIYKKGEEKEKDKEKEK